MSDKANVFSVSNIFIARYSVVSGIATIDIATIDINPQ